MDGIQREANRIVHAKCQLEIDGLNVAIKQLQAENAQLRAALAKVVVGVPGERPEAIAWEALGEPSNRAMWTMISWVESGE